ncbi:MAG TPA: hypothetical protein VHR97_00670 [Candidatus Baltobacteraceae bacterium]|jgi:hypothetical protein|nr:hypothetical protein [Candidatus Baltobacteraceae bacterium]
MIALLAASAAFRQELPAAVVSGRFFYQPSVGAHRLHIWLDTDGSGFVTQHCVDMLGLSASANRTTLPDPVLQPTALSGRLPVFDPDPADGIFEGIDAQFGATWFQGRIVSLDYPRGHLQLLLPNGAPPGTLGRATLHFELGRDGNRIDGLQFPSVDVTIGGTERVAMSFDTAATVVLTPAIAKDLNDGWGAVRATSFVTHAAMRSWHAGHPSWQFIAGAGGDGIDLLRVPSVTIGTYRTHDVWFSTRPSDDVFEGDGVIGKIGPTTFFQTRVTLDYPAGKVYFDA